MKTALKDFGCCMLGSFLYSYGRFLVLSKAPYYQILIPVVEAFLYGIACFILFSISIRFFKSHTILFGASLCLAFMLLTFDIYGASNMKLTQKMWGSYIYEGGVITVFGLIYKLLNPIFILCIWALFKRLSKQAV